MQCLLILGLLSHERDCLCFHHACRWAGSVRSRMASHVHEQQQRVARVLEEFRQATATLQGDPLHSSIPELPSKSCAGDEDDEGMQHLRNMLSRMNQGAEAPSKPGSSTSEEGSKAALSSASHEVPSLFALQALSSSGRFPCKPFANA